MQDIVRRTHDRKAVFPVEQPLLLEGSEVLADGDFRDTQPVREFRHGNLLLPVDNVQEFCLSDMHDKITLSCI